MATITVPTDGDDILASWASSVAQAINATTYDGGYLPYAYPIGLDPKALSGNNTNLAAVTGGKGGVIVVPFMLAGPMRIQSLTLRNNDSGSTRTCEFAIYRDDGTSTLQRVTGTDGTMSFTGVTGTDRTADVSTPGTLLLPGLHWAVIRNTSSSQTFNVRKLSDATTEAAGNLAAYDNTPNATSLGATIDTSGLSLTGDQRQYFVRLNGRVFGGTSAF